MLFSLKEAITQGAKAHVQEVKDLGSILLQLSRFKPMPAWQRLSMFSPVEIVPQNNQKDRFTGLKTPGLRSPRTPSLTHS